MILSAFNMGYLRSVLYYAELILHSGLNRIIREKFFKRERLSAKML